MRSVGRPAGPTAAAALLARLAAAGVRGADPAEWSWTGPAAPAGPVRSPRSRVSPSVGRAVPALPAAVVPDQPAAARCRARPPRAWAPWCTPPWSRCPTPTSTPLRRGRRARLGRPRARRRLGVGPAALPGRGRCSRKLVRLGGRAARRGRPPSLGSEVPFSYQVDDVTVRGTIDRVELTADGGVRVVDLKTGRSRGDGGRGARQPAAAAVPARRRPRGRCRTSSGRPAGGLLLYVGSPQRSASERAQPAPDDEALEAVRERVREVGRGMRAAHVRRPGPARPAHAARSAAAAPPRAEGRRTAPPVPPVPTVPPAAGGRLVTVLLGDVEQLERALGLGVPPGPTSSGPSSPPRWTARWWWPGRGPARRRR